MQRLLLTALVGYLYLLTVFRLCVFLSLCDELCVTTIQNKRKYDDDDDDDDDDDANDDDDVYDE